MYLGVEDRVAEFGLAPLDLAGAAQFAEATERHGKRLWYYYTPFLLGLERSTQRRVFTGVVDGSLVALVYRNRRRRETCDLVVPPLPVSDAALAVALRAAHALAPQARHRIMWCDEADIAWARSVAEGDPVPQAPDLVYDPDRVWALESAAYRDVRKRVARVRREHAIEVRPAGPADLAACRTLLQAWFEGRAEAISPIGDMGYTRGALTLLCEMEPPLLEAWLYEVDGEPAALSMGGDIGPGCVCFFCLKALPSVPRLSTYVRWDALGRWRGRGLVNDGSHLDRPGLAQHKRGFRPVAELPVWQVWLRTD